jgi:hypothetical protein
MLEVLDHCLWSLATSVSEFFYILPSGLLQLQWTGDIPKAIEMINQALKMDDRCEFGYETLGTIEVQR